MAASTSKSPSVPLELKSLSPYLQRADELRSKEPVMSYWCTYYAAQRGISLKAKPTTCRDFLYSLLERLERMKKEMGPNDAIDNQAASTAYIENFALKVFAAADNEDRSGDATRSTAKKFLAAANFFELLSIWEAHDQESHEDKIRYAKWKAADIAKAYREGRKPTPGPDEGDDCTPGTASAPPDGGTLSPGASTEHLPARAEITPSMRSPVLSPLPPTDSRGGNSDGSSLLSRTHIQGLTSTIDLDDVRRNTVSPGNWSTVATPGTDDIYRRPDKFASLGSVGGESPVPSRHGAKMNIEEGRGEEEGGIDPHGYGLQHGNGYPTSLEKSVHFSGSVVGGMSSTDGSPPPSPTTTGDDSALSHRSASHFTFVQGSSGLSPAPRTGLDPVFTSLPYSGSSNSGGNFPPPPQTPAQVHNRTRTTSFSSNPPLNLHPHPPPPASHAHFSPPPPPPPPPPPLQVPAPPPFTEPSAFHTSSLSSPPPASPPTAIPTELTSMQIAKAQKHCRFAISALDYEDAEQARKELRAALAVLGG